MAKILAFAGSNSSTSINHKLVKFTASLISEHDIEVLDMTRYPFEMYSEDAERTHGFSNSLIELKKEFQEAKGLIISVNEHNGNMSAYFKNTMDWLSRLDRKFMADTKLFLMATSNGKRGASTSLELAEKLLSRFGAETVALFSLASFSEQLGDTSVIKDEELAKAHADALQKFLVSLKS